MHQAPASGPAVPPVSNTAGVDERQALINAIDRSQAVIEFDLDGKVVNANRNFLVAMGYTVMASRRNRHEVAEAQSTSLDRRTGITTLVVYVVTIALTILLYLLPVMLLCAADRVDIDVLPEGVRYGVAPVADDPRVHHVGANAVCAELVGHIRNHDFGQLLQNGEALWAVRQGLLLYIQAIELGILKAR